MPEQLAEAPVRTEIRGARCTVTLDAPDSSNRVTVRAMRDLIAAFEAATRADALVLVIRADGPDFSLGRLQGEKGTGLTREQSLRLILAANDRLREFPGVSICAVQGRAYGFGSGLAVQSDLTVAAADAVLSFDEVLHGLAPLVVAEYLPRYVGPKVTGELVLTGREVSAEEALRLTMINEIADPEQLGERVEELACHLESLAPGALRLMKRYMIDTREGGMGDPRDQAVTRLDRWLESGSPEQPHAESGVRR
jgi:enoyl-CoA hydratase/carnithine racemase